MLLQISQYDSQIILLFPFCYYILVIIGKICIPIRTAMYLYFTIAKEYCQSFNEYAVLSRIQAQLNGLDFSLFGYIHYTLFSAKYSVYFTKLLCCTYCGISSHDHVCL